MKLPFRIGTSARDIRSGWYPSRPDSTESLSPDWNTHDEHDENTYDEYEEHDEHDDTSPYKKMVSSLDSAKRPIVYGQLLHASRGIGSGMEAKVGIRHGQDSIFTCKTDDTGENSETERTRDLPMGKYTFHNGDVYEDVFRDGLYYGVGKFTYGNGGSYEGQFRDGVKHGHGKMIFSNGDVYEGSYEDGKCSGFGAYTWCRGNHKLDFPPGTVYIGEFQDDKHDGTGTLEYPPDGTYPEGRGFDCVWRCGRLLRARPASHPSPAVRLDPYG